jgi:hypothetical protein
MVHVAVSPDRESAVKAFVGVGQMERFGLETTKTSSGS